MKYCALRVNTKNTKEGEEEENCYLKFGNERHLLHSRTSRTGRTFGTCGTNGTYGTITFVLHKNSDEMKLKLKIPEHCSRFRI